MSPRAEPEFRWTQDDWGVEPAPAEPSSLRRLADRHGWLIRGAIVLLALLVFEFTANAAVATAVSCLELGRTDFSTARWLWRVDPNRRRGRLNALCYLAGAFCRVGLMTLVAAILIVQMIPVFNAGRPRGGPPPPHLIGALIVMLASFVAGAAVSFWVCLAALVSGRKLWLGPEPRLARQQGIWPPSLVIPTKPATNQARFLFYLACTFVAVPLLIAATFACFLVPNPNAPFVFLPLVGLLTLAFLLSLSVLNRRILAASPHDCWPLADTAGNLRQ